MRWIVDQGAEIALIDPGKFRRNGATKRINGKLRDECTSLEWFHAPAETKMLIKGWRRHFDEGCSLSSLGYRNLMEFVNRIKTQHP